MLLVSLLLAALSPGRAAIRPASTEVTVPTSSTSCVAFTARELHHGGDHAFVCIDLAGGIVGAVLRRNGRVRCPVTGTVETDGCVSLEACGRSQRKC